MEILTLMKISKNLTANMILNGKRMKSLFFKNKNKDATSLLVSHYRKSVSEAVVPKHWNP